LNEDQKRIRNTILFSKSVSSPLQCQSNRIDWIERLLNKPLDDFRKYCITFILVPYLINIKKLPYHEAFDIIKRWVDKCNYIHRLNFDGKWRIKYDLKRAKNFKPISLHKLKNDEFGRLLYVLLQKEGITH